MFKIQVYAYENGDVLYTHDQFLKNPSAETIAEMEKQAHEDYSKGNFIKGKLNQFKWSGMTFIAYHDENDNHIADKGIIEKGFSNTNESALLINNSDDDFKTLAAIATANVLRDEENLEEVELVEKLLNSDFTAYEIEQATGVSRSVITRARKDSIDVSELKYKNVKELAQFAKKKNLNIKDENKMRKAADLLVHDVHVPGKDIYNNAFDSLEELEEYLNESFEDFDELPDEFQYLLEEVKEYNEYPIIISEVSGASDSVKVMHVNENTTDEEISDFIHRN